MFSIYRYRYNILTAEKIGLYSSVLCEKEDDKYVNATFDVLSSKCTRKIQADIYIHVLEM